MVMETATFRVGYFKGFGGWTLIRMIQIRICSEGEKNQTSIVSNYNYHEMMTTIIDLQGHKYSLVVVAKQ